MRILGVIPARGGSKGVPRKNIRPLAGKPLIAYTIEAALSSHVLDDVVVGTEDPEIAKVAQQYGAQVPFMRPAELASDQAQTHPVVVHCLEFMENHTGKPYDIIVLLQPTTPMRTAQDIQDGVTLIQSTGADSVVSVTSVEGYHPFRMKRIVGDNQLINLIDQGFEDMRPRQVLPPVYLRSGDLYIATRATVIDRQTMVGPDSRAIVIPPQRAINIDTERDFMLAEYILSHTEEN